MINKLIRQTWIFLFCGIFFIVACDKINFFSRPYVATVNGAKIYLDEYQIKLAQKKSMLSKELLSNQDNYAKRLEEEVLDNMITEKIMFLRAQELGLSVNGGELEKRVNEIKKEYGEGFSNLFVRENLNFEQWQEDLKKEMLFEKLIAVDVNAHIHVSEDEAEDYFNEHQDMYKAEPKVRVAQIVVRDLAAAQQALQRLNAGADFLKVAQERSIGPEARRGGDLGFIARQIMPEPLDKTIFKLRLNEISPIVQSSYGFHIFKILEIKPAKIKNFAESKEEVVADVRARKEEVAFLSWLEMLKTKAVIKKEYAVLRNKLK
ncbi:MAG: peptidyl-prolyl cis-trans isomerase [Smithellaceae bacterium]